MSYRIPFALIYCLAIVVAVSMPAFAGQGATRGRAEPLRDPQKEIFAKHNLSVARYYITKRKAYEGALDRLNEIVETYPEFSRADEVFYLVGEANLGLGKRDAAKESYDKLLKEYPASRFVKKAKDRIAEIDKQG